MQEIRISPSTLTSHMACPRAGYYRALDIRQDLCGSFTLLFGTAVHAGAEAMLLGEVARDEQAIAERIRAAFDRQVVKDGGVFVRGERDNVEAFLSTEALAGVAKYLMEAFPEGLEPVETPDGKRAVELKYRVAFPKELAGIFGIEDVPVVLTGRVDFVLEAKREVRVPGLERPLAAGERVGVDLKTPRSRAHEAFAAVAPQLALYRFCINAAYGIDIPRWGFVELKKTITGLLGGKNKRKGPAEGPVCAWSLPPRPLNRRWVAIALAQAARAAADIAYRRELPAPGAAHNSPCTGFGVCEYYRLCQIGDVVGYVRGYPGEPLAEAPDVAPIVTQAERWLKEARLA